MKRRKKEGSENRSRDNCKAPIHLRPLTSLHLLPHFISVPSLRSHPHYRFPSLHLLPHHFIPSLRSHPLRPNLFPHLLHLRTCFNSLGMRQIWGGYGVFAFRLLRLSICLIFLSVRMNLISLFRFCVELIVVTGIG